MSEEQEVTIPFSPDVDAAAVLAVLREEFDEREIEEFLPRYIDRIWACRGYDIAAGMIVDSIAEARKEAGHALVLDLMCAHAQRYVRDTDPEAPTLALLLHLVEFVRRGGVPVPSGDEDECDDSPLGTKLREEADTAAKGATLAALGAWTLIYALNAMHPYEVAKNISFEGDARQFARVLGNHVGLGALREFVDMLRAIERAP